jgi:flagellin-specific chaperone FliS
MATQTGASERLREYLRQLTPEAQALLLREFERAAERGEQVAVANYVLTELRKILRANSSDREPRTEHAARLFFQATDPYIVEAESGVARAGQVRRASLTPIWTWLKSCVLTNEIASFETAVSTACDAGDNAAADRLVRQLQLRTVEAVGSILATQHNDPEMKRLAGRIGSPDALEDLPTVCAVLRNREVLESLNTRLPAGPITLNTGHLHAIRAQLDLPTLLSPVVLPLALSLVMRRLASSWQLIRLATQAAETDDEIRVAATPFAVAVQLVLNEVFRALHALRADLRQGRYDSVVRHLKLIHDSVRGLRTELDMRTDSQWGRQLAAIRTEVSNLIRAEIDTVPGRVRRMLRQRTDKEVSAGLKIDKMDVDQIVSLIELVAVCRNFASELAINEVTQRTYSELQQYLERATQLLLDGLRAGAPAHLDFRQFQAEAAIRFCGVIFGDEYAALMSKAADVALLGERKAARPA